MTFVKTWIIIFQAMVYFQLRDGFWQDISGLRKKRIQPLYAGESGIGSEYTRPLLLIPVNWRESGDATQILANFVFDYSQTWHQHISRWISPCENDSPFRSRIDLCSLRHSSKVNVPVETQSMCFHLACGSLSCLMNTADHQNGSFVIS